MTWQVSFATAFAPEVQGMEPVVRRELLALARLLEMDGPTLGRPYVDTLNGSAHRNMKELRFGAAGGVWRVAFIFDPERRAILLVAGDKRGQNQKLFYSRLISMADKRYAEHLQRLGNS